MIRNGNSPTFRAVSAPNADLVRLSTFSSACFRWTKLLPRNRTGFARSGVFTPDTTASAGPAERPGPVRLAGRRSSERSRTRSRSSVVTPSVLDQLPALSKFDPGEVGEGSLDPLGLGAVAERIAECLVPGLRARMSWKRIAPISSSGTPPCLTSRLPGRETYCWSLGRESKFVPCMGLRAQQSILMREGVGKSS